MSLIIQFKSINRGWIQMSVISYTDFQLKYRFEGQISRGTFGRVFKIKQISTKKTFALKKITIKKEQQLKDVRIQIDILTNFKHPLVVQLRQYYHFQIGNTPKNSSYEFGLIMELASESVQQLIKSQRRIGSVQSIISKLFGLVQVLAVFQNKKIAHRDIKPANILIFETEGSQPVWKLADFGLAINLNQNSQIQNIAGSYDYVSPILKRKINFKNMKIKSNPFKDDVYSLGITFVQILTGHRKYTHTSKIKLKQILRDQKLEELIEIMVAQEESRRPGFQQLLEIIHKDFQYLSAFNQKQSENLQDQNTRKVKKYSFHEQDIQFRNNYSPTTKTICKKYRKSPKISLINLPKRQIQSVISLDGWVMCGCLDGEIIMLENNDSESLVSLGKIHKKYVSQFMEDKSGNIWSVGGGNYLIKFKKYSLRKALINNVVEQQKQIGKVFKKQITQRILNNVENISEKIVIPKQNNSGISSLFIIDEQKYSVGFNDGSLFIFWSFNQIYIKAHREPIISIKVSGQSMYTCSPNGEVKKIDLLDFKLSPKFYRTSQFLTGMQLFEEQGKVQIRLATHIGKILFLDENFQQIFQSKISSPQIISSINHLDKHYCLTQRGAIYDTLADEQIAIIEKEYDGKKGWNCFNFISDNEIVIGGYKNGLAIVEF